MITPLLSGVDGILGVGMLHFSLRNDLSRRLTHQNRTRRSYQWRAKPKQHFNYSNCYGRVIFSSFHALLGHVV